LDEETLQVEVAPGTVVKVARQAVARVIDNPYQVDTRDISEDPGDDQTEGHHP